MPPPSDFHNEGHQCRSSTPLPVLAIKLVSMTQLGSKPWLSRTSLTEGHVPAQRGNDTDVVRGRRASVRRKLHDIESRVGAHGRVTLLSGNTATTRSKDACELLHQGVVPLRSADTSGATATVSMSTTAERMAAEPTST